MIIKLAKIIFLSFCIQGYSQVGINTTTPQTTLEVVASNQVTPTKKDGILIPKVSTLIATDGISNGMLVYLKSDYENYKKGFYWKNENNWIPFFSTNQMKADQTIALINTNSRFVESTVINSNLSTSVRKLTFDGSTLKANDSNNFSVNSNGELVVLKSGKYVIQSIITIEAETTDAARDAIDIEILKNDVLLNPTIGSTFSYPNTTTGDLVKNSTSVNGFVNLNSGDRLSLRFNRYYRDSNGTVIIKPIGNISTFTLRYIGS